MGDRVKKSKVLNIEDAKGRDAGPEPKQNLFAPAGHIEVDMFSEDINSRDHPEVMEFKRVLLEEAEKHECFLTSFEIDRGTITFSFNNDELTAKILDILQHERQG